MQRVITRGAAANAGLIFHVFAQDSTKTDGSGKASIAYGSWTCYYIRNGEAISGAITPQDITTIGTYAAPTANTNIRIKAVDNTNMIGVYELQIHLDWVNVTNACQSLTIFLSATGVAVLPLQIPLTGFDLQTATVALAASQHVIVDSGTVTTLTNLPAVTTDWLTAAGVKADAVTKIQAGLATPTNITAASGVALAASQHVIVDSGTITTYTGNTPQTGDAYAVANTRLPTALTANGNMKSSLVEILTTALTETSGQLAAAFKKFFNIATPAATMDHGILVDTVTTLTNAPADSTTLTEINADVDEIITTLGAAGAGLTALGDTRIANLDATISSRTKPADTQAAVTTVTTLTNLPAAPTDWLTAAAVKADAVTKIQAGLSTYAGGDTSGTTTLLSRIAAAITITGGKVDVNDKTGFGISATSIQAIWDALTSVLTTTGSIGKWILDKLDVAVSSRGTGSGTALDAAGVRTAVGLATANLDTQLAEIEGETDDIAAIKTKTDQLVFTVANQVDANALSGGGGGGGLDAAGVRAAVGLASANLDTQLAEIEGETDDIASIKSKTDVLATGTDLVNAILDEPTAGHATAGTVGKAIGDVGALNVTGVNTLAGHDPGATLVKVADLGTVQTGDAFARIGIAGVGLTNLGDTRIAHLDADISTRTKPADTQARVTLVDTLTTYTGNTPQTGDVYPKVDTEVASIKTVTDQFRFTIANQVDANTLTGGGGGGLDAAGVRAAVGLASANLDTQLAEIEGETDDIAAVKAKTDNLPASPAAVGSAMTLTSGERTAIANALMDLTSGVEASLTPRQAMRLMAAALAGKISGMGTTTIVIRNAIADSKDRITATVDADGNRSAITVDLS